ncbi:MAG: uracil-DNA glycosylase [Bacteroidales bacterium]
MTSSDSHVNPKIEESWKTALAEQFQSSYFQALKAFLVEERAKYQVYPAGRDIFAAFDYTPVQNVKVVILGQDPYHGPGQAHGLCFSVPVGIPKPPSLVNILKELKEDLDTPEPPHGNLSSWARQGVLLLNATLTVRANQPTSHQRRGWETFTDAAIRYLSNNLEHLVFLLWGNPAGAKSILIDETKHMILKAPHPSPLSAHRGFFGCRHFSKTNLYLSSHGIRPIDWNLQ